MSLFALFALLVTVTAVLAYLNERFIRLPQTIGVMVTAMALSLALIAASLVGADVKPWAEAALERVDFDDVLMRGMLSFLLFAGALHVDLSRLLKRKGTILTLATVGVVLSTALTGGAAWLLLRAFGLHIPWIWALLFGALITPTDPIAVLGILKRARTDPRLESMVAGESLFNDGVGVVVFTMLLGLVGGEHLSLLHVGELFVVEAIGGALLGLGLGYVVYLMLKSVDNYTVEVLITLALVMGGYTLAGALHSSGPIAMVVAGLFIGNHGRTFGMSEVTRAHLDTFWELIDEILNAVLFVLIGLEMLVLESSGTRVLLGALAIPVVLLVRLIAVGLPMSALSMRTQYPPYTVPMLTWCGVRGGISIALALSLPAGDQRDTILVMTYVVVVFSILVQGLTVGRLARWVAARSA